MYLSGKKKYLRNMLAAAGVVLWVGALSPEIYVGSGTGCILDENGEELTTQDAEEFMEAYFYGSRGGDGEVKLKYKLALVEWLK